MIAEVFIDEFGLKCKVTFAGSEIDKLGSAGMLEKATKYARGNLKDDDVAYRTINETPFNAEYWFEVSKNTTASYYEGTDGGTWHNR